MFDVDDIIMYGNNGVCRVVEIGYLDISGIDKKKLYYTLQPVYSKGSTVYTPVENDKVVMRKIISENEAIKLIQDIPNIEKLWVENEKLREEKFKESMKKYDCKEWIKIIKTLYQRTEERKTKGKKMTAIDKKYLKAAEDYLYSELSIPLNIPKDKMEDYIKSNLNAVIDF